MGFFENIREAGITAVGEAGSVFQGQPSTEDTLKALDAGPKSHDPGFVGNGPGNKWSGLAIIGVVIIAIILWNRR